MTWGERGVVLAIALVGAIIWAIVQFRQEDKRRAALRKFAAAASWDSPKYSDVQAKFEQLRGKGTWTSNPIVSRDGSCVLFDYKFMRKPMGSARWSYAVLQTVVYVRSDRLDLPLISIDSPAVPLPARKYLSENPGIAINAEGNEIFIFRTGILADPEQLLEYARWGQGVAGLFEPTA